MTVSHIKPFNMNGLITLSKYFNCFSGVFLIIIDKINGPAHEKMVLIRYRLKHSIGADECLTRKK